MRANAMNRAWICVALIACGDKNTPLPSNGPRGPTVAAPEPAPPRSPLADSFAKLPLSITSAEPKPLAWFGDQMTHEPAQVLQAACAKQIAAKVDGYYSIELARQPDETVFHPSLLHTSATLDEIRRCRIPEAKRKESTHPKVVVATDSGFFPVVFADLSNGWLLMIDGELEPVLKAAEAVASEPPATANGLANAVGMKPEPGWKAVGLDVTSEVLGVPSLGVRADFTPTPPLEPLKEPIMITAYFASAGDANRALTAMGTPRDDLFGDTPKRILELARKLGEVRIDGTTVVYRGPLTKELSEWEQMFVGRGKPIGR